MNVKNDISEELSSLSAFVATISRETPYRAPEGYFLQFPAAVLERVQPATSRIACLETNKPLTFNVPEGYFEGFAQQVLNRIKAGGSAGSPPSAGMGEEEMLPAILLQARKINPYTVPEGFFEGLSPILAIVKDRNPYTVPEGYFDGLSPILAVVKNKNPYLVPAGYFNSLAEEIRSKTADQPQRNKQLAGVAAEADLDRPKTQVISLGKRMNWMRYAAAAVVAGLIVSVGWLRWHPGGSSSQMQLAAVPAASPAQIIKNLSKVSDAELQNFLVDQDTTLAQPVGNVGNVGTMATVDMDDSNLKTLLGDVSDGELRQYMDEHGGASDIATN